MKPTTSVASAPTACAAAPCAAAASTAATRDFVRDAIEGLVPIPVMRRFGRHLSRCAACRAATWEAVEGWVKFWREVDREVLALPREVRKHDRASFRPEKG